MIVARIKSLLILNILAVQFYFLPFVRAQEASGAKVLSALPANTWVKIHEQKTGDKVVFGRQAHGGSCFDSKRGQKVSKDIFW